MSDCTNFPEYMRSNATEVVDAYRQIIDGRKEWQKKLTSELSKRLGQSITTVTMRKGPEGSIHFAGLPVDHVDVKALPGKWKKPHNGAVQPYRRNPVYEGLKMSWERPEVPGVEPFVMVDVPGSFMRRICTPGMFLYDGHVYLSWGTVTEYDGHGLEHGWEEIKGSEYLAARESINRKEAMK